MKAYTRPSGLIKSGWSIDPSPDPGPDISPALPKLIVTIPLKILTLTLTLRAYWTELAKGVGLPSVGAQYAAFDVHKIKEMSWGGEEMLR